MNSLRIFTIQSNIRRSQANLHRLTYKFFNSEENTLSELFYKEDKYPLSAWYLKRALPMSIKFKHKKSNKAKTLNYIYRHDLIFTLRSFQKG